MHLFRFATLSACLVLAALPAGAVTRRMFVTSVTGNGNLSTWAEAGGLFGVAAGDAVCQARATAASLPNPSAYRAWLSDSLDDAYCRLHDLSGKVSANCGQATLPAFAGPWWRTDGEPFGAGLPALVAPLEVVLNPPVVDEWGALLGTSGVWTGTVADGSLASSTCDDWTSSSSSAVAYVGWTSYTAQSWTWDGGRPCNFAIDHLYCFESGSGDALPARALWGRLAFVTSAYGTGELASWPASGGLSGLAGGDAICRGLATAAGLRQPEAFKAWLSAGSTDAIDRFAHDGPWLRLDGYQIATGKADLTDGALPTSLHRTETGEYLGKYVVFTGTLQDGTASGLDCLGWISGSSDDSGSTGLANQTTGEWTQWGAVPCHHSSGHLYCLQDLPLLFRDDFETGTTIAWSVVVP